MRDLHNLHRRLIARAFAMGCVVAPAITHAAEFDGSWSVVTITEKGDCDRGYTYAVVIAGGKAAYTGDADIAFGGTVASDGAMKLSFEKGTLHGSGAGKLEGKTGAGKWNGRTAGGACSGRWQATEH